FVKGRNIQLKKNVLRLQTQLEKFQKYLTSTQKKEKQVRHKLMGTRFASSKLKQKFEIAKKGYSHKGREERHIMGVQTWCPIESKPRAYVLANSLRGSGKTPL
ncbi:hypothetical protein pdam_00024808, partial [Pocillopora damicornis]